MEEIKEVLNEIHYNVEEQITKIYFEEFKAKLKELQEKGE
jgi:hypothetical protein